MALAVDHPRDRSSPFPQRLRMKSHQEIVVQCGGIGPTQPLGADSMDSSRCDQVMNDTLHQTFCTFDPNSDKLLDCVPVSAHSYGMTTT